MVEGISDGGEKSGPQNIMRGIAALTVLTASPGFPSDLVQTAYAQEQIAKQSYEKYEKQEANIPSVAEIDKMVRDFAKEKDADGMSQKIEVLEQMIFKGGDIMAGIKIVESMSDAGIALNLRILRGRLEHFKQDTTQVDQLLDKVIALRNIANEAYIDLLHDIPDYIQFITIGLKTEWNANNMHKNALIIARANDALMEIQSEVQKMIQR